MKRIIALFISFMLSFSCVAEMRSLHGSLQLGPDISYEARVYAGTDDDGCDIYGGGILAHDILREAFLQLSDEAFTYALNGDVFGELNTFGELLTVNNAALDAAYRLINGSSASQNEEDAEDGDTYVIAVNVGAYLFDGGLDEDIASFRRAYRSEARAISRAALSKGAVTVSGGETVLEADTGLVFEIIRLYLDGLENDSFSSDELSCTLPWLLMGYSPEGSSERLELIEHLRSTLDEAESSGVTAHVLVRISADGSYTAEAEITGSGLSAKGTAAYSNKEFTFEISTLDGENSRVTSGVLTAKSLKYDYTTAESGEETTSGSIVIDFENKSAERSISEKGFNRRESLSISDKKLIYTLETGESAPKDEFTESKLLVTRMLSYDMEKDEFEYTSSESVTERVGSEFLLPGATDEDSYSIDTHAVISGSHIVYDITDSYGDWIKLNAEYEEDVKVDIRADACLYGTEFTILDLKASRTRFALKSDRFDRFDEDGEVTVLAGPLVDMYVDTENNIDAGYLYDGVMYTLSGELAKGDNTAQLCGKLFADGTEVSDYSAGYTYSKGEEDAVTASAYLNIPELSFEATAELSYDTKNAKLTVDAQNGGLPFIVLLAEYMYSDEAPAHAEGRSLTADETAILLDRYDRFMSRVYGY